MGKIVALMGILGYWMILILLFVIAGSPFAGEGFTLNSTPNITGNITTPTPAPTLLDLLFDALNFVSNFVFILAQIFAFLILGIGLPASYPATIHLIFGFWNFFIFVVAIGIVISFFTGD